MVQCNFISYLKLVLRSSFWYIGAIFLCKSSPNVEETKNLDWITCWPCCSILSVFTTPFCGLMDWSILWKTQSLPNFVLKSFMILMMRMGSPWNIGLLAVQPYDMTTSPRIFYWILWPCCLCWPYNRVAWKTGYFTQRYWQVLRI